MLATCSSPLADFVTASGAVFPSEPGAPLGHRGISPGVWAFAARVSDEIKAAMTRTDAEVFIGAIAPLEKACGGLSGEKRANARQSCYRGKS